MTPLSFRIKKIPLSWSDAAYAALQERLAGRCGDDAAKKTDRCGREAGQIVMERAIRAVN